MGRKEGWRSLWRMALLAASILSSCFLLIEGQGASTQIQIEVQPEHPIEGQDVTLTPKDPLTGALTCVWYRGRTDLESKILTYFPSVSAQNPGPAFTNRETAGPGCSLTIRNLTSGNTGNYTLTVEGPGLNAVGYASVVVSVPGPNGSNNGLPGGAIAGIVIGCLAGVVLVSGLLYYICTKTSFGRKEQHASNGNVPSAPGHNEGVTDTKPKAAEEDIQYSILAFKDHNSSPPPRPTSEAPQPSDGVTIYSEIKKK